jgi:hypothetical protein
LLNAPKGRTLKAWWTDLKDNGVGEKTIHKFLGGNWSLSMVREALATIKDDEVDKEKRKNCLNHRILCL